MQAKDPLWIYPETILIDWRCWVGFENQQDLELILICFARHNG